MCSNAMEQSMFPIQLDVFCSNPITIQVVMTVHVSQQPRQRKSFSNNIATWISFTQFYLNLCSAADQAGQPIPGYFYGNENSHSKGKKSSETKIGDERTYTFATTVHEVHYELWLKETQNYRFWKEPKWRPDSRAFRVKIRLNKPISAWFIHQKYYLSKLSDRPYLALHNMRNLERNLS